MLKKDAIKEILEYYNENKEIASKNEALEFECKYFHGILCAIKYILITIYGFKTNDKRFK